jgi:hypothetical protein
VFNNPVKIPQWILPSNTELKEFSSPLCLSAHCLNAHLAEYLFTERPTVLSSCAPMHLLNAHLAELSESSVILVLPSELTTESSCALLALNAHTECQESLVILTSLRTHSRVLLNAPLCICSMPTWQSFTELLRDSVCNCVLPPQPCLQGIQQP